MIAFQPAELSGELVIVAFSDPTVEASGFGPDHGYIEGAVAAIVGPSTCLLWKRLARIVIEAGDRPVTLDTSDLLGCIGLRGLGKNSPGARTIARMVSFDMARRAGRGGDILAVRQALAPLSDGLAARLPASARLHHDEATRKVMSTARTRRRP